MSYRRYGIYFTPPLGAFADAGAKWLGWDVTRGAALPCPFPAAVERPQKYGFHATLKAPFQLSPQESKDSLAKAFEDFCAGARPAEVGPLALTQLGAFLAFTPEQAPPALQNLARDVVVEFDRFRAPLTPHERTRKTKPHMSEQQRNNLECYGYAHIFDDFRFHMTLTGPLAKTQRAPMKQAAEAHFEASLPTSCKIDALTLVGEDAQGKFHVIQRRALIG